MVKTVGEAGIPAVSETERAYDPMTVAGADSDLPEGVRFLMERLSEGKISVIAIGPLTNIAMALRRRPEAFSNLERLVSMGGNFKSFGNCSPVAEFNYWVDPEAARYVFEHSKVPVEMVGLDVTRKILLTPEMIAELKKLNHPMADFIGPGDRILRGFS